MSTMPLESIPQPSRLVSVVDADAGVREGVRALLATVGAEVRVYGSGRELLAALDEEVPACVIAEMQLPDMSGLDLLAEFRKRGLHLPTILLSSEADVSGAVQAMRAGALDFVEKPYIERALLNQVAPLLGGH